MSFKQNIDEFIRIIGRVVRISGSWGVKHDQEEAVSASLSEVNATVPVDASANFWRKFLAFSGPGFLIAVGHMDPGKMQH